MIDPRAMTVQELQVNHPDYDAEQIEEVGDFYEGGKRFEKNKDKYLRRRQQDTNPLYRKARLACADYTAPMAGKIDDLAGGILRNPPRITVKNSKDARASYWANLIRNADGNGVDLAAVVWNFVLGEMLHARSYFLIRTPQIDKIEGETTAQAKARGRLDCTLTHVGAETVNDWSPPESPTKWFRTFCIITNRDGDIGPPKSETHRWTYFESDAVTIYEATRPYIDGKPRPWQEKAPTNVKQSKHGLGVNPLIPCEQPDGFNLGARLLPIAKSLFNREAAKQFNLDASALNMAVLVTEKPVDQVPLSEWGVLNVGIGGDYKYAAPSGDVAKSQADDAKDLRDSLDGATQAMAEKASAANDRTSGVAQQQFRAPKEVLMALYAMPGLDALTIAVNAIAAYRDEADLEPKIEGLDDFDTQGTELAIANTQQFVSLPGMPLTAKKLAIEAVIAAFIPDIDPDDQKEIDSEIDDMEDESPAPAGGGNASVDGPQMSPKTGLVAGADKVRQKAIKR